MCKAKVKQIHSTLLSMLVVAGIGMTSVFTIDGSENPYFKIKVVDEETGRGVPLVELKLTNEVKYYTDSNGIVAFYEPGLMGEEVFFHVSSHGYSMKPDGFGYEGVRLHVLSGEEAIIEIKRENIAERIYRITGQGIYRDSIMVGEDVPTQKPVLNGKVMGQDSTLAIPYDGKIFWFWGDTSRPAYPLGNFKMSGATSELPSNGGLDPATGINLHYFTDDNGFAKSMYPIVDQYMIWSDGYFTLNDESGQERLYSHYNHIKTLGVKLGHGLAVYHDEKQEFEKIIEFSMDMPWQAPQTHPIRVTEGEVEYFYFPVPFPTIRVIADLEIMKDQTQYEAFTCLKEGTQFQGEQSELDVVDGKVRYSWKKNTDPINPQEEQILLEAGLMSEDDAYFLPHDINSGELVVMHFGSVYWNNYRDKWVMISNQIGGTSFLGEVWYLESDTLTGPWKETQKIVTHDQYDFYNPVHHEFFDQENGRIIYFEGTYANTFSGNPVPTPWYDYNQIMYRLDLENLELD